MSMNAKKKKRNTFYPGTTNHRPVHFSFLFSFFIPFRTESAHDHRHISPGGCTPRDRTGVNCKDVCRCLRATSTQLENTQTQRERRARRRCCRCMFYPRRPSRWLHVNPPPYTAQRMYTRRPNGRWAAIRYFVTSAPTFPKIAKKCMELPRCSVVTIRMTRITRNTHSRKNFPADS